MASIARDVTRKQLSTYRSSSETRLVGMGEHGDERVADTSSTSSAGRQCKGGTAMESGRLAVSVRVDARVEIMRSDVAITG